MYALILHGRRSITELQKKWCNLRVLVNNASSSSFSSATSAAIVRPRDGLKEQNFTVISYLVDSLGLTSKLAESVSRKVNFVEKGNPDSVLSLLRSHEFTDTQISSIITEYPRLLIVDAEKSLGPKLKFLQSRGVSTCELTEIVSKVPKILMKREGKTSSAYYDFIKEIIEADKSSKFQKLCHSSPQGHQENIMRNVSVLRELGMPQKLLFSMLISDCRTVCGKEKFEESLKKVVEMGFDPTSPRFVQALNFVYQMSNKTLEEKVNVYKRLGFFEEDVWRIFKKWPALLGYSEKKILNSFETFIGLGISIDEFMSVVKRYPPCFGLSAETVKKKTEFLVKKMNWPLKVVVSYPVVLGLSMEKRIVPRCNVIKSLISKGSELPPLASVLVSTEETFLKRYVRKHDDEKLVSELMTIFTGKKINDR